MSASAPDAKKNRKSWKLLLNALAVMADWRASAEENKFIRSFTLVKIKTGEPSSRQRWGLWATRPWEEGTWSYHRRLDDGGWEPRNDVLRCASFTSKDEAQAAIERREREWYNCWSYEIRRLPR